jgi:hypothetical protein
VLLPVDELIKNAVHKKKERSLETILGEVAAVAAVAAFPITS